MVTADFIGHVGARIKKECIKEGAIVIDVGINRIEINIDGEIKNKLVGDVDYSDVE